MLLLWKVKNRVRISVCIFNTMISDFSLVNMAAGPNLVSKGFLPPVWRNSIWSIRIGPPRTGNWEVFFISGLHWCILALPGYAYRPVMHYLIIFTWKRYLECHLSNAVFIGYSNRSKDYSHHIPKQLRSFQSKRLLIQYLQQNSSHK